MTDAIAQARAVIAARVALHPANPFYQAASRQMQVIDARLADGPPPDRAFYESLTHGVGLMCARELETSDMPFCDAVYAMLEEIRLRVV